MTVSNAQVDHAPAPSKMGLWGVIMVIYFTVAGGAFGLEGLIGASAPGMALILMLITPFIWSMPTVLMVVELATAMPVEGGFYVWVKRGLGRFWAFVQGWLVWLYGLVIAASFAALGVEYTSSFLKLAFDIKILDESAIVRWLLAAAMIGYFAFLNIRGAKAVGDSSKLFAVMVFAPFIVMVLIALVKWIGHPVPFWQPFTPPDTGVMGAFGVGLFIVMYNFMGWDGISTVLEEIENPLQVIPKAMMIAVPIIILAYFLPAMAGMSSGIDWKTWGDTTFFPELAAAIGGKWLGIWVALGGMFCAMGLFNAMLLSNSRLPFVFAADKYFPAGLVKRHTIFGTPYLSIILCAVIYALLLMTGSFEKLAVTSVLLYGFSLILQMLALLMLRIKEPNMPRPFKIPGGLPFVILLVAMPTAIVLLAVTQTIRDEGSSFLALGGALLASAPLAYYITKAVFKRGQPDVITHEGSHHILDE